MLPAVAEKPIDPPKPSGTLIVQVTLQNISSVEFVFVSVTVELNVKRYTTPKKSPFNIILKFKVNNYCIPIALSTFAQALVIAFALLDKNQPAQAVIEIELPSAI